MGMDREFSRSDFAPTDERGATMVEFTMAFSIVVFILGAIFDIGLGYHQYSYLNHTTLRATREINVRLATTRNCAAADRYLADVATPEMRRLGSNGANTSWSYTVDRTVQPALLRVTGAMPLSCYFLCPLLPASWNVSYTGTAFIESPAVPASCQGALGDQTFIQASRTARSRS